MSSEASSIAAYLRTRPIAPIYKKTGEKKNAIALKFMFILDYEMEQNQLYDRVKKSNNSMLLRQLMQFHTFKLFTFYDYTMKNEINEYALQCKECGLIGPYAYILSHMAVNHILHVGSKVCVYCNNVEIRNHIANHTLKSCYENYLNEQNIKKLDRGAYQIVIDFYVMLRTVSQRLSLYTVRNQNYEAKRPGRISRRVNSLDSNENFLKLDDEFNRIKDLLKAKGVDLQEQSRHKNRNPSMATIQCNDMGESSGSIQNDDDDVMIVENVKTETPLDIQVQPQNDPTTSGLHYHNNSDDLAVSESISTAHLLPPIEIQNERKDAEEFGRFVAQSLAKLPTEIQRRQLEIEIEIAILNAKKKAFGN